MPPSKIAVKERTGTTIKCGWCRSQMFHPPIKVPVTPWVYTPNGKGVPIQDGMATYVRVCLPCAKYILTTTSQKFFEGKGGSLIEKQNIFRRILLKLVGYGYRKSN